MKKTLSGLVAGLALLAAAPSAFAGPTVNVRVEGAGGTLLERTRATLPNQPASGNPCAADSAGAALQEGTRGNWDHKEFTQTILGETHKFDNSDYWAEWIDRGAGYKRGAGLCSDRLAEGDELLMLVDLSPPPDFAPTVFPLDLEGVPARATRGDQVTVTVVEYRSPTGAIGEGERTPAAGAQVSGAGASAITGPDGKATLRVEQAGSFALKAVRERNAPSAAEPVTVTETPQAAAVAPVAGARDRTGPVTAIALRSGATFSRRSAPRVLKGSVGADQSGVRVVKLRLTQRSGSLCRYFSGSRERFLGTRCGRGSFFAVADRAEWSYLLPGRLPRGSYVLEAKAVDGAYNRGAVALVRFRVR